MKDWLADIPFLSLLLFKLCHRGGSEVYAEWRWKRCQAVPSNTADGEGS